MKNLLNNNLNQVVLTVCHLMFLVSWSAVCCGLGKIKLTKKHVFSFLHFRSKKAVVLVKSSYNFKRTFSKIFKMIHFTS